MAAIESSKSIVPEKKSEPPNTEAAPAQHARMLEPFLAQPDNKKAEATRTGTQEGKEPPDKQHKDKQPPDKQPQEWTVAINLAVNLDSQGAFGHLGSEDKMTHLDDLAAYTRDKPVTIIVQAIERKPGSGSKTDNKGEENKESLPETAKLNRYIIKDGTITQLPSAQSHGYADDLTAFLQIASKQAPSLKTALVVNSHGIGNMGLSGDAGKISLTDFEKAVTKGLAGSGHNKLDLLDFDACLMAQNGVLQSTEKIAKHLVAAAEIENTVAAKMIDGQNLDVWLMDLLNNPKMDGAALGRSIVENAKKGYNNGMSETEEGTPSLSAFDLKAAAPFRKSLDTLGLALAKTIEQPANNKAVQDVIDSIPPYANEFIAPSGGENPRDRPQKRDLKLFMDGLSAAIEAGKITDKDGKLNLAITSVQTRSAALTEALHTSNTVMPRGSGLLGAIGSVGETADRGDATNGTSAKRYSHTGGLSVFLPESQYINIQQTSKDKLPLARLMYHCQAEQPVIVRKLNAETLGQSVELVEKTYSLPLKSASIAKTWAEIKSDITEVQKQIPGADEVFLKASDTACRSVEKIMALQAFQRETKQYQKKFDPWRVYIEEGAAGTGGWNEFLQKLKRRASH
jgi:Clostripain family